MLNNNNLFTKKIFSNFVSYRHIGCLDIEIYLFIYQQRRKYDYYDYKPLNITTVRIEHFKSFLLSNKKENYKKILHQEFLFHKIIESIILLKPLCELITEYAGYDHKIIESITLLKPLCELITEYAGYDHNHEIVIYDEINYYRLEFDIMLYTNGMGGVMTLLNINYAYINELTGLTDIKPTIELLDQLFDEIN